MENAIKIKSASWITQILIPIIILSFLFISLLLTLGEFTFQVSFAIIMSLAALLHLLLMFRTRNASYSVPFVFYIFGALTFYSLSMDNSFVILFAASGSFIFFFLLMYTLSTKKIKWRHREVLELAARSVKETEDGYTSRPYPITKVNYSIDQILNFSALMLKYVIAYPIYESNRVVLVVPENMMYYLMGLKSDYQDNTYIALDFDGNVSVKISQKDYKKYREELTFDQLCSSFGYLFLKFIDQYIDNQSQSIIEHMNDLKFVV